ncbi:6-phosphofructokinase [Bacteriovoracaceae bacterium]|nr:6-phosphofructokinase [Bacteriovoracaceae bacterium]
MSDSKTKKIKKIAVLTSGGDSPGMNCAIRAIVRNSLKNDIKIYGIKRGYSGLIENEILELNSSSVGNILQKGGTFLQSSRSAKFLEKKYRKEAVENLYARNIDALIVIGGDGSFNGALALKSEFDLPIIGIPGTIDNDILNTQYTIGFDTAVNTAISAVDKIRDTAHSFERNFLVEVMGRNSSAIAIKVGICTGAENILLPNEDLNLEKIANDIKRGIRRGKRSSIIIVAEGTTPGRSYEIAQKLEEGFELSSKVCVLGHIQRGGSPTASDRFIATKMGVEAVNSLVNEEYGKVTCWNQSKIEMRDIEECAQKADINLVTDKDLAELLSI